LTISVRPRVSVVLQRKISLQNHNTAVTSVSIIIKVSTISIQKVSSKINRCMGSDFEKVHYYIEK
jgi:hypothetical protein